ncbi:hypothetical protein PUR71_33190 [Streptomyces sp. SP17BM10]|uniref:hypothetical protein n=1 Tax=Streptomyces sp. SP17BM10 TaxID=3002530 RepID=UPI002E759AA5|nr:hypothetical protein [Streptomyces sp. SP17BM10]MEE1787727.1 hypothetical protein [Streptomyces sp. SP17BM10]
MPATPRTISTPTLTGRSYARRVATLTSGSARPSAGAWVAEAQGTERQRRAVVCRLGRLTGTRSPRWSGEISEEDWRAVLAAGAATLAEAETAVRTATEADRATCAKCGTKLNRANTGSLCNPCKTSASTESEHQQHAPVGERSAPDPEHLAVAAQEFTRLASSKGDRVVDRTRNGRVEALVNELLAAQPVSALDLVGEDERRLVETWSPFRNGPRHIVRCADGSRRYGNGELAPEH